ncbi:MAG: TonB-dependent receptor [Proteobacteria bacterium]|nr:TonB-dependent receptor [Pseudomonadota bacterium]MBU1641707.1 TonB-dependent receptor [Pseudomonadota bacterium]
MKKYSVIGLAGLWLLAGGALSFAQEKAVANGEDEFLALYFDEAQVVEAATRVAKPLTQVAENVTIITAAEIERMNAHNVGDVLNRVAGVYVNYNGLGFNQSSYIYMQGSSWEHVVVLLDGVRVNKASVEVAFVNMIPVRTIKRIEVIKGAASSTWGSALGGVINIITKDTGSSIVPEGTLQASYGEHATHDVTAELSGKASRFSYYVYGGNQESDGLLEGRGFKNSSGYGKLRLELPQDMSLEICSLYTRPEYTDTYWQAADFKQHLDDKNTYLSARFDALLVDKMNLHAEVFRFDNDYRSVRQTVNVPETMIWDFFNDQKTRGGALRLDYSLANHKLVAGADYQKNEIQMTWKYRDGAEWDSWYPSLAPFGDYYAMDLLTEDVSGYYINDTFVFDRLTITPGLRWDHISTVSKELTSPSLGLTYQLADHSLVRASVSKGFRKPPVLYLEGNALYGPWYLNPNLDAEKNWTYQLGAESTAIPYLHVKTTLFFHDVENTWDWSADGETFENTERSQRQGFELEVATKPVLYTSLKANFTYTYSDMTNDRGDHSSTANIILLFDHPEIITAELSGHYVKWGEFLAYGNNADYNKAMLWDLSLNRSLFDSEQLGVNLFATVRNIFNGNQYVTDRYPNAPRYAEVGLKFRF